MRLHVRYRTVDGLLNLVKAYASLAGHVRGVDCKTNVLARAPAEQWSRCSLLSANRVRLGTMCCGSNPEPERVFVDSGKGHDQNEEGIGEFNTRVDVKVTMEVADASDGEPDSHILVRK